MDEEKKEETKVEEKTEEVETTKKVEEKESSSETVETKTEVSKDESKKEEPKVESISSKKSGGNKLPIILAIVAVILIAVACVGFYFLKSGQSADKVYKHLLEEYKEQMLDATEIEDAKKLETQLSLDVDLKLTDGLLEKEILDLINEITLDVNSEIDLESNEMAYNVVAKKSNKEIINVDAYILKDKMYAKLNGLLDKYVYFNIDDLGIEDALDIDYNDMLENEKIVISKSIDAIIKSLKSDYFTLEKVDDAKKNILTLDDAALKEMLTDIMSTLKDDDKFVSAVCDMSNIKSSELTSTLETAISNINKEVILQDGQAIQITIYTEGMRNEVTKAILEMKDGDVTSMAVTMDFVSDEKFTYEVSAAGQKITGYVEVKEKSKDNFDVTLSLKYADYIDAKIMMNTCSKIDKKGKIDFPNFDDAVEFSKMTDEDGQKLLTNIQNNEALMEIYELIADITGENSSSNSSSSSGSNVSIDDSLNSVEENELTNDKFKVTFEIPKDYELDKEYSSARYKYFEHKKDEIEAYVKIGYDNVDDYFADVKKYDYEYKTNDSFYSNVELSDVKEMKINKDLTVKYVELKYNAGSTSKYDELFAIYELDDDYAYIVEIEARNASISTNLLEKYFMNITVKELKSK